MNIFKYDIVFQEVPNHISLAFYVCGCSLRCPGCHSAELWTEDTGKILTKNIFQELLDRYENKITCVLFLGGEWHRPELIEYLRMARNKDLKTALYTGLTEVPTDLKTELTFLKTGPWKKELGGLSSPTTNQIFHDLSNNTVLNHLFQT